MCGCLGGFLSYSFFRTWYSKRRVSSSSEIRIPGTYPQIPSEAANSMHMNQETFPQENAMMASGSVDVRRLSVGSEKKSTVSAEVQVSRPDVTVNDGWLTKEGDSEKEHSGPSEAVNGQLPPFNPDKMSVQLEVSSWDIDNDLSAEQVERKRSGPSDDQRKMLTSMPDGLQPLVNAEASFTSQIEQWNLSDTAKAEGLVITHGKFNQPHPDLSTSTSGLTELQQRFNVHLTELDSIRQQLHDALVLGEDKDHMVTTLADQLEKLEDTGSDGLKDTGSDRLKELKRTRAELEEVWSRLQVTQTIMESTPDGNATFSGLVSTVDSWMRADKQRAQNLEAELSNREKEISRLKDEHEKHSAALKSAQIQLDDVRRFVTSADNYVDTVMIQTLQKLNVEVQHSTTIIADFILQTFRPHAEATEELDSARTRVSESIGQVLTDWLEQESADELTLYLQIAFQAYLSERLSWIISSWTLDEEHNEFITKIYDRMQIAETQTVSGRWRSLTRAYMAQNSTSDGDKLIADLVEGLSDIVLVAGCATSVSDAKSKFSSKFKDKVSGIVSLAGRFGRMIGEVVSSDFAVLAANPLQIFEEDTMEEDVDDDDQTHGASAGQKVVCSTWLGLTKRIQLESGKKHTSMVMKTMVILESFLEGY